MGYSMISGLGNQSVGLGSKTGENNNAFTIIPDRKVYWDFGNTNCYPGSGSSVFDLSGNSQTGTLINTPTYSPLNGGGFIFVTNKSVSTATNSIFNFGSGGFTTSIWVKFSSVAGTQQIIDMRPLGVLLGNLAIPDVAVVGSKVILYWQGSTRITGTTTLVTGVWYNVVCTRVGTTITLYLNGASEGTYTSSASPASNPRFNIGTNGFNGTIEFLAATIALPMYYSAGFNITQVLQNYNIDKNRFL